MPFSASRKAATLPPKPGPITSQSYSRSPTAAESLASIHRFSGDEARHPVNEASNECR